MKYIFCERRAHDDRRDVARAMFCIRRCHGGTRSRGIPPNVYGVRRKFQNDNAPKKKSISRDAHCMRVNNTIHITYYIVHAYT